MDGAYVFIGSNLIKGDREAQRVFGFDLGEGR